MNFARPILIVLTCLFAIGSLVGALFASKSDSTLYFVLLFAMCVPGLVGIALFNIRSRLNNSNAKLITDLIACLCCLVTVGMSLEAYYEVASIPAMLVKEDETIRQANRRKQVYKFEEADFDIAQKRVVFWKTPKDRSEFIETLYLITVNEKMVLIVKKERQFSPLAHVFNDEKVVQVKVTMSQATDDQFSAVGSFLLNDASYSFNHPMSEIKHGYDIDPEAPLMKSIFPKKK